MIDKELLDKKVKQFNKKQFHIIEFDKEADSYLVVYRELKPIPCNKLAYIWNSYAWRYGPSVMAKRLDNGYLWTSSTNTGSWLVNSEILKYLIDTKLWAELEILTADKLKKFED